MIDNFDPDYPPLLVGQTVRVKTEEELRATVPHHLIESGFDGFRVNVTPNFVPEMNRYCGENYIIKSITSYEEKTLYHLPTESNSFSWRSYMFVTEPPKKTEEILERWL